METPSVIAKLETEWVLDTGFFGLLRTGVFDPLGADRVICLLKQIDLGNAQVIDRRLVSVVWFIPIFMSWQTGRIQEKGGDLSAFAATSQQIENILIELLGNP